MGLSPSWWSPGSLRIQSVGSQVEVHLDGDLMVVGQEADEDGSNDEDEPNDD